MGQCKVFWQKPIEKKRTCEKSKIIENNKK